MRNRVFNQRGLALLLAVSFLSLGTSGCGNFWQQTGSGGGSTPTGASLTMWTNTAEYSHGGTYVASQGISSQEVAGEFFAQDGLTPTGGATIFGNTGVTWTPLKTGSNGDLTVSGLDLNAEWMIGHNWEPVGCNTTRQSQAHLPEGQLWEQYPDLTPNETYPITCEYQIGDSPLPNISPGFVTVGWTGSTLTAVASTTLTTAYGNPQLNVLDSENNVAALMTASSVAGDGVTATFPYPVDSSGNPLPAGLYSTNIDNVNSDGSISYAGGLGTMFSIGSISPSYPGAFGVAAVNTSSDIETCITTPVFPHGSTTECDDAESQQTYPVVTLPGQNQLSINGSLVNVGENPTAVVSYGTNTITTSSHLPRTAGQTTTTGTGYAVVTNTGDGTVSIVDILNKTVLGTVSVGNSPVAVSVTPDASTAYVVNYVDGTVSKINLSSYTVTATQNGGLHAGSSRSGWEW